MYDNIELTAEVKRVKCGQERAYADTIDVWEVNFVKPVQVGEETSVFVDKPCFYLEDRPELDLGPTSPDWIERYVKMALTLTGRGPNSQSKAEWEAGRSDMDTYFRGYTDAVATANGVVTVTSLSPFTD